MQSFRTSQGRFGRAETLTSPAYTSLSLSLSNLDKSGLYFSLALSLSLSRSCGQNLSLATGTLSIPMKVGANVPSSDF